MVKSKYSTGGDIEHEVSIDFLCVDSLMYTLTDLHDWWNPILCY